MQVFYIYFQNSGQRKAFMKTVQQLMKKLVSYVSVDQAADEVTQVRKANV